MNEKNPIIDFANLPNFADIQPPHVTPAVDALLVDATAAVGRIVADAAAPAWESVCQPMEEVCEKISRVWNQVELMHSVMSTDEWRQAYQDNLMKVVAFYTALGQNEKLYQRMRDLQESPAFAALTPVRQKIISDGLRDFVLSGVNLPAAERKQFRENSEQQAALAAKFEENILNATNAFTLTVDDAAALGEMPEDLQAIARQEAEESGWRFTLQAPSFIAFMQYVNDRDLREKMYHAYSTRASEFTPDTGDNSPLMADIMRLRQAQAGLLGFDNYADTALQTRMAESPAAVRDFLYDLAGRAKPAAEKELQTLREFAQTDGGVNDLQPWDVPYFSERLKHKLFDFSDADLRPYLQETHILNGLFDCIKQLFGVTAQLTDAAVWRDDVRYLQLQNADGRVIGGLYMDLYAGKTKRGGAWMADALSRYRHANRLQLPVAHVCCNFAKPVKGPALLNWGEVVVLFHEFGHALHHLLTEVDEYSVSGISGVEWDAVELPSQWFENFVWDYSVLRPMTKHVDSGDPMPEELFAKVLAARRFQSGMWLARQLEFSIFDLLLHSQDAPDIAAAQATAREVAAVMVPPDYNRFPCSFSHIFAGGYAAGYYSYLWAEVLAADIFAMFSAAAQILDPALGDKFRRNVLAVGGSRPAMESFVAMRGRKPDIGALLRHYGLAA